MKYHVALFKYQKLELFLYSTIRLCWVLVVQVISISPRIPIKNYQNIMHSPYSHVLKELKPHPGQMSSDITLDYQNRAVFCLNSVYFSKEPINFLHGFFICALLQEQQNICLSTFAKTFSASLITSRLQSDSSTTI